MGHSLIVGYGEVGRALGEVLRKVHHVSFVDLKGESVSGRPIDVLHICIPYSEVFEKAVERYRRFCTRMVIHSTVPVGTSSRLGAHHSPVRGMHPRLAESMRTFTTYLAPGDDYLVDYFQKAGMKVERVGRPEETEAGKLWELTGYAWSIMLEKEIHRYCEEHHLDFDVVYRRFTETYNQGYEDMGRGNVQRPVLNQVDGPIGGHCVIPGVEMLEGEMTAQFILALNSRLKAEKVPA